MKTPFLLFISLSGLLIGNAQPLGSLITSGYPSLGTYSKKNVDLYATKNNAASLAQLPASGASAYTERKFLQTQLSLYAASIGLKTKSGGFALHVNYYGFNLYNQMQISLAYGLKINEKIIFYRLFCAAYFGFV